MKTKRKLSKKKLSMYAFLLIVAVMFAAPTVSAVTRTIGMWNGKKTVATADIVVTWSIFGKSKGEAATVTKSSSDYTSVTAYIAAYDKSKKKIADKKTVSGSIRVATPVLKAKCEYFYTKHTASDGKHPVVKFSTQT